MRISRPAGCQVWATWIAWSVLLLNLALVLVIADRQFAPESVIWLLILTAEILLGLFAVAVVLPLLHRHTLDDWRVWFILLGLWGLNILVQLQVLTLPHAGVRLVSQLFMIYGGLSIMICLGLVLHRRDLGLAMVAVLSAAWLWMFAFAARSNGLIEPFMRYLHSGEPRVMAWLGCLSALFCCIIPLGLISFALHTVQILRRERRDASPEIQPPISHTSARRLLDLIETPSPLTCAETAPQIAAIVAAEVAGHDVDTSDTLTSILTHLDRCQMCAERYASYPRAQ